VASPFQVIVGADGKPAFVVVPYEQFRRMKGGFTCGTVPNEVVNRVGASLALTRDFKETILARVQLLRRGHHSTPSFFIASSAMPLCVVK
jgi:hypothetical protein